MDDIVEVLGRDAGDDVGNQRVKDLGGEAAGAAHARESLGAVQLDHAVLRFHPVVGGDGDVLSHGDNIEGVEAKPNRSS